MWESPGECSDAVYFLSGTFKLESSPWFSGLDYPVQAKCVISISLPEWPCSCLSIQINSTTKLWEEMLFRANDASNSNRPSRLLMDFNSSYYGIIVFSQQLFVDTILHLQDLDVQSQETAHHSFIIIWFHLRTNVSLFAFGDCTVCRFDPHPPHSTEPAANITS